MAKTSAAKTAAMLTNTESMIEEMKHLRDEFLPERCAILTKQIRINKRSANSLFLTAHLSLQNKIAYKQQKCAVTRQKDTLAKIESQKAKWSTVLEKAKEQKKQLKRLQKVQQEYEITSRLPTCDELYKMGLEKRMTVAIDRCLRAQRTYGEIVQQVKIDTGRLTEDREWHRKQDELDEKAMERVKEVARKQREAKVKSERWGSPKCKSKKSGKGMVRNRRRRSREGAEHGLVDNDGLDHDGAMTEQSCGL